MTLSRRLLGLSSGAMLIVLASLALLAPADAASARQKRTSQATATPAECLTPIPVPQIVLTIEPPDIHVGSGVTLTLDYVNLLYSSLVVRTLPEGRMITDPPRDSPCRWDHPAGNRCRELTFRAQAAGAVTIAGGADGEIAVCNGGRLNWRLGGASLGPAHITVWPAPLFLPRLAAIPWASGN